MENKIIIRSLFIFIAVIWIGACKVPSITGKKENRSVPSSYSGSGDTSNVAKMNWRTYFKDENLVKLIDTALANNQELNITLQEIEITKNEVMARKGEYLPFLNFGAGVGPDRAGKYTWDGFSEEDLKADPARGPKYVGDFMAGAFFSWELDVWKKLRNAIQAADIRYMASIEARNFLITQIVAEIARSYYELIGIDNQLEILQRNRKFCFCPIINP